VNVSVIFSVPSGVNALENVPPFPAKWLDPQPILDFFTGVAAKPVRRDTTSHDIGSELGLHLETDGDEWRVGEVIAGGAAAETGIVEAGDVIKSVNGSSLKGLGVVPVADLLGGPAGTQAVLLLQRQRNPSEALTVFVTRRAPDGAKASVFLSAEHVYDPVAMRADNRVLKESIANQGVLPPPPLTSGGLDRDTPSGVVPQDLRIQVEVANLACRLEHFSGCSCKHRECSGN